MPDDTVLYPGHMYSAEPNAADGRRAPHQRRLPAAHARPVDDDVRRRLSSDRLARVERDGQRARSAERVALDHRVVGAGRDRGAGSAAGRGSSSSPTRSSSRARCMPRHWCGPVPNARWCCTGPAELPLVGVVPARLVAVRRTGEHADRRARRRSGSPATSVSAAATRLTIVTDVSHRSVSSMTSGIRLAVGVRPAASVVGVREQREQRVAHHAERRLAARGQQQPQEAVDLAVGEPLAVDLGVHEIGEEVAGRVRRAAPRRAAAGSRPSPATAACPRSGAIGPVLISSAHCANCVGVLERHARRCRRSPAPGTSTVTRRDEVGAAERRDRVEQPVDRRAHERVVPLLELRRRGTPWRRGCGTCGAPRRPSRG